MDALIQPGMVQPPPLPLPLPQQQGQGAEQAAEEEPKTPHEQIMPPPTGDTPAPGAPKKPPHRNDPFHPFGEDPDE